MPINLKSKVIFVLSKEKSKSENTGSLFFRLSSLFPKKNIIKQRKKEF